MNKVWKILVVSLLAVVLLGLTTTALAEVDNKISITVENQTLQDTVEFDLLTYTKGNLKISAAVLAFEATDPNAATISFTPENLGKVATLSGVASNTWSLPDSSSLLKAKIKEGGHCEITVSAQKAVKLATWKITVSGNYKVKISKTKMDLGVGKTATLTTEYAGGLKKTWTSSDDTVATVDKNGKVTAKKTGTATISCKAGSQTVECEVTVYGVSYAKTSMKKGTTKTLTVANMTGTKTWSTSNASVATVDKYGNVTAVGGGTANITCKAGKKASVCKVTVYALSKSSATMSAGETLQLSVKGEGANDKVIWSTSDQNVVKTTNYTGGIKAIKEGTATISAKVTSAVDGKTYTLKCKVTVKKSPYPMTMQVTGGKLALRKSPSGTLIKYVNNGTKVKVTGLHATNKAWAKVEVGGQKGYMMLKFLKKVSGSSSTTTTKPTPNVSMKVINGKLALRKSAGGSLIGYVKDGASVLAADAGDGWCYVKVAKKYMVDAALQGDGYYYGYMMKSYLQKK